MEFDIEVLRENSIEVFRDCQREGKRERKRGTTYPRLCIRPMVAVAVLAHGGGGGGGGGGAAAAEE